MSGEVRKGDARERSHGMDARRDIAEGVLGDADDLDSSFTKGEKTRKMPRKLGI